MRKPFQRSRSFAGILFLTTLVFMWVVGYPIGTLAGPYTEPVYEAPSYVPPPPPQSKLRLVDNGDGTITDPDSKLMWTKADSYADLGKCLNWYQSRDYMKDLTTGGHTDWRIPGLDELFGIYDNTKENVMGLDHDPNQPLHLDEKFADGAAYWYWSSEYDETNLTDCCSRTLYFVKGIINTRRFSYCQYGGVRAVRNIR